MKTIIKTIFAVVLTFFSVCDAADIYIDPSTGTPTQSGAISAPYDSWGDVVTWATGTTYYQRKGTTYYGSINPNVSGTTTGNYTITSYIANPGSDTGRPIIYARIPVEGTWTLSGGYYMATQTTTFTYARAVLWVADVINEYGYVEIHRNGTPYDGDITDTSTGTTTPETNSWSTISDVIYYNKGTQTYTPGVDLFWRSHSGTSMQTGITVSDSNVSIVGINVKYCTNSGISASSGVNNLTVEDCVVEYVGNTTLWVGNNGYGFFGNGYRLRNSIGRYAFDDGVAIENLNDGLLATLSDNIVSGCSFHNNEVGIQTRGYGTTTGYCEFIDCLIYGNGTSTDLMISNHQRSGCMFTQSHGVLTNCSIYGNGGAGIYIGNSTSTTQAAGQGYTIQYCDIYNNNIYAAYGTTTLSEVEHVDHGGISINSKYTNDTESKIYIYNNTIHETGTRGAALRYAKTSTATPWTQLVVKNNVLISDGTNSVYYEPSQAIPSGCDFDNNVLNSNSLVVTKNGVDTSFITWNAETTVGTDLQLNPLWIGSSTFNHRLASGSLLKNAGLSIGSRTTDILGNSIIGIRDIGAFESRAGLSTFTGSSSTFADGSSTFTE